MKVKLNEKDKAIYQDIKRMKDESRRINQILRSDDYIIDLLKQDIRKKTKSNSTKSLPNLIFRQGNNLKLNTRIFFKKKKQTKSNINILYPQNNNIKKDNHKNYFNKYQIKTFYDDNNCTYDYFKYLKKIKKLNELFKLNFKLGIKKEKDYQKLPLNYKNLEKDFEYIHNQLYDDYEKIERYKKTNDFLFEDNKFQPHSTKNIWKPIKINDYYLKKSLYFNKIKLGNLYRNNNNNDYNLLNEYINKIEETQ